MTKIIGIAGKTDTQTKDVPVANKIIASDINILVSTINTNDDEMISEVDTRATLSNDFNSEVIARKADDDLNKKRFTTSKVLVKNSTSEAYKFLINFQEKDEDQIPAEYISGDQAFRFTGGQSIPTDTDLDFSAGVTILFRAKAEDFTANGRVISNGLGFNPTVGGFYIQLYTSNTTDRVLIFQCNNNVTNISEDISSYDLPNNFLDCAITVTAAGVVNFFVNGNLLTKQVTGTANVVTAFTRPLLIGNLERSTNTYDRPFNGNIQEVTIYPSVKTLQDISKWNSDQLLFNDAVYHTDIRDVQNGKDGIYYYESDSLKYRDILRNGVIQKEVFKDNAWIYYEVNNLSKFTPPPIKQNDSSTDGWGNGNIKAHIQPILTTDFEYINTGVNLSASVGEAFHGLASSGEWLVQPPQDHSSAVFYNTITGEVRSVDLSAYVRAIPVAGSNFRDKFNGATSTHGGRYIWLCPSWTTHIVKIDTLDFTIAQDFLVNSNKDDAYNGIIATRKYIWAVTHSKEDLPRINIETGVITFITLTEPVAGDYNFGNGAANRSFLGGSDNGDGTIWLHPRRSKHIVKIDEETGNVLVSLPHPVSSNPAYGSFNGASNVNGKIWFSPWAEKKVVSFDLATSLFSTLDVTLTGSEQWNFGTTTDGRFIYMPPYKSREIIKIDTLDSSIHVIDASTMVTSFLANKTRSTTTEGFAGGSLFMNGSIWFSSSFESCYLKLKVKEVGSDDVRTQERLLARKSVMSSLGEFYFSTDLRLKRVGVNLEKQQLISGSWVTQATL